MPAGYDLVAFSREQLETALATEAFIPSDPAMRRIGYLHGYLDTLEAKSILIEHDYTDGPYLEDFASYYVRCHQDYPRKCRRLHFFSSKLTDDDVRALAVGDGQTDFAADYLGFVVARPLPMAVIGRTVLRTYPPDGGRRNYTATRDYVAHVFGAPLTVRSLAFQEQDTVLAACATVALWCAFHKAGDVFHTPIPRPATITRAGNQVPNETRAIPSDGLNVAQMAQAVRNTGLEPQLFPVTAATPVSSLAYGYLSMGLPVIAVIEVEGVGLHAVTLTGYSIRDAPALQSEVGGGNTTIPMTGLNIDEFYAHDDQIGPFARMHVRTSAGGSAVVFEGDWLDPSTGSPRKLTPKAMLVPVYDKIRVTFLDIQEWLTRLHGLLRLVLPADYAAELAWDIRLTTTNRLKEELRTSQAGADLEELLFTQHPRFIWTAELRLSGKPLVRLLCDATDMAKSFPPYWVTWREEAFAGVMKGLLSTPSLAPYLEAALTKRFLAFLRDSF